MVSLAGLPKAARYVSMLPDGLDSHPEAAVKGSTAAMLLKTMPDIDRSRLPDVLRQYLDSPPPASVWVPEVHLGALCLACRDLGFEDDIAFLETFEDGLSKFFAGPLYRIVMSVATPTMMCKHGPKRWSLFRRGSTRSHESSTDEGNIGHVDFPPNLFTGLYAEMVAVAIQAAYRMSRAKQARTEIVAASSTRLSLRTTYYPPKSAGIPHFAEADSVTAELML